MSVSYISENVKCRLWGKAGGRCEYDGCNEPLWHDSLTKSEFNAAYIAHIIADSPRGPRGDPQLSEPLKNDITNLMLLCDEHHRLIDRNDIAGHPAEKLREMKRKHEERIERLTSIKENKQSHMILYGANIGKHNAQITWHEASEAMCPYWYPAENYPIELSLKNSSYQDHEDHYWEIERDHLRRQFEQKVQTRISSSSVQHFSIFGLAPQPLLIELGHLLSDIPAAEVYQRHREPPDWNWQSENNPDFDYIIQEPKKYNSKTALNISLSATINESRITEILGDECSIWTLTIENPNNDFLESREKLSLFRRRFRELLDHIKAVQGENEIIHIFPAVPVAVAVEIGRVRMAKADLPYRIYDQNRSTGGFSLALKIPKH